MDIQTDQIKHQNVKKTPQNEYIKNIVFDQRYRISFEIPTPASPSIDNWQSAFLILQIRRITDYLFLAFR